LNIFKSKHFSKLSIFKISTFFKSQKGKRRKTEKENKKEKIEKEMNKKAYQGWPTAREGCAVHANLVDGI
jgi:hypothetical protein